MTADISSRTSLCCALLLLLPYAPVRAEETYTLREFSDLAVAEVAQLRRLSSDPVPDSALEFQRYLTALRQKHQLRASTALDFEIVKLFRNPIAPGNCFYDFLVQQAASQGAVSKADRLSFLSQACQTLDAASYSLRFQGTWRALTSTGCPPDSRSPIWHRYLASRGVDVANAQDVMDFVETTAAAYDEQYRNERQKLIASPAIDASSIGFRSGERFFLTSIFDTAFRLDRLLERIRRYGKVKPWQRVLVAGPGLNIVDQFLGTQVPVSSPQPVCLLESLLARELADERTRVDLVDLSPEVIRHWREAAQSKADYHVLGYLLAGEEHGQVGRLTRAYLDEFGARTGSSRLFESRPPTQDIHRYSHGIYVRDLIARPAAIARFSMRPANIVTDRISDASTYDLVVATNVLLYFDVREGALAVFNLGRLLKPGGYLLVTEDLDSILAQGHLLRRVWMDDMKEVAPDGAKLPSLYIYQKQR